VGRAGHLGFNVGVTTMPPSRIPRELRIRMHEAIMKEYLNKSKRLSISDLVSWLRQRFYKSASKISRQNLYSLVYGWIKRGVSPYNEAKTASIKRLRPRPELAYILGATLGDGTWRKRGTKTEILLRVRDYDFALAYARCYNVIEGKRNGEPVKPHFSDKSKFWIVSITSITLYNLLEPFKILKIKKFVEANVDTISAFIRGFFDAEGTCLNRKYNRGVYCSNKNRKLMRYIKKLLKGIGIESKLLRRSMKTSKGRLTHIWILKIHGKYIKRYADLVGFEIKRKRDILQEIINDEHYQVRYFTEFLDEIFQSQEKIAEFLKKFFKYRGSQGKGERFIRIQFKNAEEAKAISAMLRRLGIDHRERKTTRNRTVTVIESTGIEKLLQKPLITVMASQKKRKNWD